MFLPDQSPFSLDPARRREYLEGQLRSLLTHHCEHCEAYARLVEGWAQRRTQNDWTIEDYPFIPVSAFKEFELKSTDQQVARVQSSATTTGRSSNIYVDKPTKKRQSVSANRILADFIGQEQRPYLVFDVEETVRGTAAFSARGAAILSLAHMADEFFFVMRQTENGDLVLDDDAFGRAMAAIAQRPFIAYGFTYVLYQAHEALAKAGLPHAPAAPGSVLLHSGGWKRLQAAAIDKPMFNRTIADRWGLPPQSVIDFYGTVEQVGVPYPDCSQGLKHAPYWADVLMRRADTLAPAACGETGLIQLISALPLSAPNHSVLTEDLGQLVVEDGCQCGRRGPGFIFQGRAPRSEVRGCSDIARY